MSVKGYVILLCERGKDEEFLTDLILSMVTSSTDTPEPQIPTTVKMNFVCIEPIVL